MRRTLTTALDSDRDWSWARELNLQEVIETTAALRGEFLGLEAWEPQAAGSIRKLSRSVTIDGFSGAGKTTLARMLGGTFDCKVIDSGLVFRTLARANAGGLPQTEDAALDHACLATEPDGTLFDAVVTAKVRALAADPESRALYEKALLRMLQRHAPCIVIGRDTWKLVEGAISIVIDADFETRLRRKYLRESTRASRLLALDALELDLRRADLADIERLPGPETPCARISNGRRPLALVYGDLLNSIENVHER
jgi:cytidylate kinase